MARSPSVSREGNLPLPLTAPTLQLAQWQLRQTWRLLLVTGLGVLLAVTLVCSMPSYYHIATIADLRGFLNAVPATSTIANSEIEVTGSSPLPVEDNINTVGAQIDDIVKSNLSAYLNGPVRFFIQNHFTTLLQPPPEGQPPTRNELVLTSTDIKGAVPHLKLLAGRLPHDESNDLEIVLSVEAAQQLHLKAGDSLGVIVPYILNKGNKLIKGQLQLHIVGILATAQANDPFWHKEDFRTTIDYTNPAYDLQSFKAFASSSNLLHILKTTFIDPISINKLGIQTNVQWYYRLDTSRIDPDNIDEVVKDKSFALQSITPDLDMPPFVISTQAFNSLSTAVGSFSSHTSVLQITIRTLSILVLILMLFFVSLMINILVERQFNAISVLRSRGASLRQIVGSLTMQSIVLGLLALVLGPLLALGLVQVITGSALSGIGENVFTVIRSNPGSILRELVYYALGTVAILLLAMIFAIWRAARMNVLILRRDLGRSLHRAIWQRISLDMVAALLALLGYAVSLYVTSSDILDAKIRALIVPPVTLLEALCLVLAASLLFLRFFPALLQLSARIAARGRSATSMLAMAQLARAPQQAIRMIMLLTFALAFAFFTLTFTASQTQRITDVTNYEVGADFNAGIPDVASAEISDKYAHLPGVLAASIGYRTISHVLQQTSSGIDITLDFRGVDAATYAHTAIWSSEESSQSLSSLMHHLLT
ncbi:MAG: FtsX-like permease family protein, partial [Chloroflexota bacterium]|nr:FtsX-like permease family protein [Chloroflexota bacterium]